MERGQFTFYASYLSALSRIKKPAERAAAYDAIAKYALFGELPDMDKLPEIVALAFDLVKPTLDSSRKKAENGRKKGTRAEEANESKDETSESKPEAKKSKAEANESKEKQKKANHERGETANEKEKEKEKEREKEEEIEGEREKENECSSFFSLSHPSLCPPCPSSLPPVAESQQEQGRLIKMQTEGGEKKTLESYAASIASFRKLGYRWDGLRTLAHNDGYTDAQLKAAVEKIEQEDKAHENADAGAD